MTKFYLGTHMVNWIGDPKINVPLFVSHHRLVGRKTLPRAINDVIIDSGGFTQLSKHGHWITSPEDYVRSVTRYAREIGIERAAIQDYMCEPPVVAKTGLDVETHQRRTVASFVELSKLWPTAGKENREENNPFWPTLQGWALNDYLRCWSMYDDAGIDIRKYPAIGVGSVCRRQSTNEIGEIFISLREAHPLPLHGFGVKKTGLIKYGEYVTSADSMAWSFRTWPHAEYR
jgi:hypothetical protein